MHTGNTMTENLETNTKPDLSSGRSNECDMTNISPYMSKGMIAAAGFNVETPIVNAIIGNLSGTLPTRKKECEMIKCEICDCELSSNTVLSAHMNGSKHQKRVKALEIIEQLKDAKDKGILLGHNDNPKAFKCEICLLTVNSVQQLEIHLSGAKHKKRAAKVGNSESEDCTIDKNLKSSENSGDRSSPASKKKKKNESRIMTCDTCKVFLNSKTQYDQHLLSRKHFIKTKTQRQSRKIPGKGKFMKLLPFKSGGTHPSKKNFRPVNQESSHFNPQMSKTTFQRNNFVTKTNCRDRINTNSLRKFLPGFCQSGFYRENL